MGSSQAGRPKNQRVLPLLSRYLDLEAMLDHLAGVGVFGDEDFAEYGLDEPRITDLRNWVTGWYDDLGGRLAADLAADETSDDS